MSEYLGNKLSTQDAAKAARGMQFHEGALSVGAKHLAEIHPVVSEDVETDTASPDFGRIKNKGTALNMALMRHAMWDGEKNWMADMEVDEAMAREIKLVTAESEGEAAGVKAKNDYLITQGYVPSIEGRFRDIRQDIHTRSVNPVYALRDIIKSHKAKRHNHKQKV